MNRPSRLALPASALTRRPLPARIKTADVVIAELSGANPNVFLEIGYAWGKGRPTILLAKSSEELRFDVRGQRVLKYENLVELRKALRKELKELKKQQLI
jgi:nucleoside 2-deoxyribosyltransferase